MNPNALTNAKQAFQAGARAALRGASILTANYKNPLMVKAYERGYQRAMQLKGKTK